ncbi:hypothetical protein BegalDRAFT_1023 [Beggiatoa alba B18LD]|uniref:Uncharacterized protein n=1 Tax=Beggiatoa alba B18LD TaxID=395493 RepID=I3CE84_9GAMM|nr:hypothetical protein [Beggiatoa alba]EIJ41927.1 hypothetical protein BegalDRAFT_1023 [Beggiatoa alba B18LD]
MSNDTVLALMREKLEALERATVLENDPARLFSLKHQIQELKAQIATRQSPNNTTTTTGDNRSINAQNSQIGIAVTGDNVTVNYHSPSEKNTNSPASSNLSTAKNPTTLRKTLYDVLQQYFSVEEVQKIKFSLAINLDKHYDSTTMLIMALIEYCERHQKIDALIYEIVQERPDLRGQFSVELKKQ